MLLRAKILMGVVDMDIGVPCRFVDVDPPSEALMQYDYGFMQNRAAGPDAQGLGQCGDNIELRPFVTWGVFSLKRLASWDNPRFFEPATSFNEDHPIWPIAMAEVNKLERHYNADVKHAVLHGLEPGKEIANHTDHSDVFAVANRVHLSITTDPGVKFFIDGGEYHFPAGKFFELNNKVPHSVVNNSNVFRVHLVVDLLSKDVKRG